MAALISTEEQLALEEQLQSLIPIAKKKGCIYKTKLVKFFGRSTPIILQNENGNVLLLRGDLKLSPGTTAVSQKKLLSLVAGHLILSICNVDDNDEGYIEYKLQNVAAAIDLLPRLTTGIDINLKFKRIADFEFTQECAIFILLDIPLYHGWIVDPQDHDTATAIGSKSYNYLMGEIVALETQNLNKVQENNADEEECVDLDFAASTTATLEEPSPYHTSTKSFDDLRDGVANYHSNTKGKGKGDLEEEAELLRALHLSYAELSNPDMVPSDGYDVDIETLFAEDSNSVDLVDVVVQEHGGREINFAKLKTVQATDIPSNENITMPQETASSTSPAYKVTAENWHAGETTSLSSSTGSNIESDSSNPEMVLSDGYGEDSDSNPVDLVDIVLEEEHSGRETNFDKLKILQPTSASLAYKIDAEETTPLSSTTGSKIDPDFSSQQSDKPLTPHQGQLIRNFLMNNASQLTVYGLFCLQKGLKEGEICVLFRNNHLSTMVKYEGELYVLASDQGFINQTDLVWEKLNEVNGDTLFMTGDFKEFDDVSAMNNITSNKPNRMQQQAIGSVYNSSQEEGVDLNRDHQLAIALQQQEYEEKPCQQFEEKPQQLDFEGQTHRHSVVPM